MVPIVIDGNESAIGKCFADLRCEVTCITGVDEIGRDFLVCVLLVVTVSQGAGQIRIEVRQRSFHSTAAKQKTRFPQSRIVNRW